MRQKEYSLTKQKYLSASELELLEALLDKTLGTKVMTDDFRNALVIKLLVHTGARVSEILNLKKTDLNIEDKSILVIGLKGSRDREVPLPRAVFLLLKMFAESSVGDKVFNVGYDTIRNSWLMYRPVEKKLHSLRHACALRVYEKTKDIKVVSTLLGHKSILNSQIYLDYQHNTSQLRKALGVK